MIRVITIALTAARAEARMIATETGVMTEAGTNGGRKTGMTRIELVRAMAGREIPDMKEGEIPETVIIVVGRVIVKDMIVMMTKVAALVKVATMIEGIGTGMTMMMKAKAKAKAVKVVAKTGINFARAVFG